MPLAQHRRRVRKDDVSEAEVERRCRPRSVISEASMMVSSSRKLRLRAHRLARASSVGLSWGDSDRRLREEGRKTRVPTTNDRLDC
jgi:hypothetical protein